MKWRDTLFVFLVACLMAGFTNSWNEATPAGSDAVSTVDDRIREFKTDVRERMAIEHYFPATDDSNTGRHRLDFGVIASRPAADAAVSGAFYWATDEGTNGKLYLQDGVPAWVQVGAGYIADLADAAGDPLTQYLLADGTRTLTDDMLVTASKTIDGVDVGAHNHDGTAGMGVQLDATAFAANAITEGHYATDATFTADGTTNWQDVGAQVTFTPADASNQIIVLARAGVGFSSTKQYQLGLQIDAGAQVATVGPHDTTGSTAKSAPTSIIYMTTHAASSMEIDVQVKPADTSALVVTNTQLLVVELKR